MALCLDIGNWICCTEIHFPFIANSAMNPTFFRCCLLLFIVHTKYSPHVFFRKAISRPILIWDVFMFVLLRALPDNLLWPNVIRFLSRILKNTIIQSNLKWAAKKRKLAWSVALIRTAFNKKWGEQLNFLSSLLSNSQPKWRNEFHGFSGIFQTLVVY